MAWLTRTDTKRLVGPAVVVALVVTGCTAAETPDVIATVDAAVAATQQRAPTCTPVMAPTGTPYPTYTPLPTLTPFPTRTPEPSPTPTDTPTPEPTPTPVPTQAPAADAPAPAPSGTAGLVRTMKTARGSMEQYGGWIDRGLRGEPIDCEEILRLSGSVQAVPAFTMTDPVLQWANDRLHESKAIFAAGTADMTRACQSLYESEDGVIRITYLQWSEARGSVVDALNILIGAIDRLAQDGY